MTLGWRIALLIVLASLPVFLIQITHDVAIRQDRQAKILDTADTLAGLVAARQDRIVEGARLLLIGASQLQSVREKDAEQCNARLKTITDQVPELTAIAVLSSTGERWCVSIPDSRPMNLGDREYFQSTLRTGRMQSSDFIIGRQTGEGSIAFTFPIVGPSGAIESVLFLAYRTSVMSRMLNEPPLPDGAIVALVGKDGVIAARWPEPDKWIGKSLISSKLITQAIRDQRGKLSDKAEWAGPGEYAFAFAALRAPSHLTAVVGLSLTDALRENNALFRREVAWTTLIFALTAALASLGAYFMVARPVKILTGFVDALAKGNFRSGRLPSLRGSSELTSLGRHFEDMAKTLEEQKAQLLEAMKHKELLLKEVNHRVKNSLQLVASLFGIQRQRIRDPDARRQFDEAARRIKIVAQIHQRLYQDDNFDSVSFDQYLLSLCEQLRDIGASKQVSLKCKATPCQLPIDQVIPVALIVNELVTNAFKYSFPGDQAGVINIDCREDVGVLILTVSDNGAPLPEDFDSPMNKGLGTKIITGTVKQLRASLEIVRQPRGKSFIVRIPLEQVS